MSEDVRIFIQKTYCEISRCRDCKYFQLDGKHGEIYSCQNPHADRKTNPLITNPDAIAQGCPLPKKAQL